MKNANLEEAKNLLQIKLYQPHPICILIIIFKKITRRIKYCYWTTRLAGVNGVVGMLDLGVLTRGGSTPSVGMAEVKTKEISPTVDIILPIGTPKTGESKGLT